MKIFLWKDWFLPNGHGHIRERVSGSNFVQTFSVDVISSSLKLLWRLTKRLSLFVEVSHGRFHDILPKEYYGIFPEFLWGKMICYKLRCLLTKRVSQILSLTRLILEIKRIICQKDFSLHFYLFHFFMELWRLTRMIRASFVRVRGQELSWNQEN